MAFEKRPGPSELQSDCLLAIPAPCPSRQSVCTIIKMMYLISVHLKPCLHAFADEDKLGPPLSCRELRAGPWSGVATVLATGASSTCIRAQNSWCGRSIVSALSGQWHYLSTDSTWHVCLLYLLRKTQGPLGLASSSIVLPSSAALDPGHLRLESKRLWFRLANVERLGMSGRKAGTSELVGLAVWVNGMQQGRDEAGGAGRGSLCSMQRLGSPDCFWNKEEGRVNSWTIQSQWSHTSPEGIQTLSHPAIWQCWCAGQLAFPALGCTHLIIRFCFQWRTCCFNPAVCIFGVFYWKATKCC